MRSTLLLATALTFGLLACSKAKETPPDEGGNAPAPSAPSGDQAGSAAPAGSTNAAFEARRMFSTICATCHGSSGHGDGPASQALNPKPRNYTDKTWQASVTDDDIKKIILLGGQAVGKSAVMPAQPQLQNQPEVLDEIVKLIRAFGA
jgi:mono/diheme cytochrome c family protein